ncbi:MAG: BamA/TamA family outer membrane protein [Chitinophagaceae bacterium]|nr:BamA/TamA family outer membrane protein [Chitinophagaceae bacterium]
MQQKGIFFLTFFFLCANLFAQDTINTTFINSSSYSQKDIIDCFREWFKFKPSSKTEGIKPGDRMVISVLPAAGYTLQTRLAAILSGNLAFYTSNYAGAKLSVINSNITYTQNKQFTIPVQLNVWLPGNEWNLSGDWRFMKYPQSTFGLGSNASLTNETPMDYHYIRIYQHILKKITPYFSAGVGYDLDYHWNISETLLQNNYISDYTNYGATAKSVSSGLALNLVYDSRKNIINPTQGLLVNVNMRNNVQWLGSDANWQSLLVDVRKYISLPGIKHNLLALWSYNWVILGGRPPYLDLPSTGWDGYNNTGRGFIQGRFRGSKMLYFESEYRFDITNNGLLGAVVFANAETFSAMPKSSLQAIQPGAGAGIRIKLNKKSSTNIAIDYGFGTQGSKGLFVNIGEVF